MTPEDNQEYLLGANKAELARLQFQHEVWKTVTESFFDRLNVGTGWHCLDVGAGPGFVASDLRDRVGEQGSVTILEPSKFYVETFRNTTKEHGWANVECILGTAETMELPKETYDLIFVRWVVSFVPDLDRFFANLLASLKPGGVIAFQDYYYEGLSLFPRGAFNSVADIMRSYYRSNGGNAYVAAEIPGLFRRHNIKLKEFTPHSLSGGYDSDITEWAGRFFTMHLPIMVEKGFITKDQCDAILGDWNAQRMNPDMVFFSPIVVDVAGIKS